MLRRYIEIHEESIEANSHHDSDFTMNCSSVFLKKTEKYYKMLAEIDVVARSLQKRGKTSASCRADIDTLISAIKEEKTKRSFNLFNCPLGTKYIGPNSIVAHPLVFEQAIRKIQEGRDHK